MLEIVPFSKATLLRLRKAGEFPEPIRLVTRAIAWPPSDIERCLKSRQGEPTRKEPKRIYRWGHSQGRPKSSDDDLPPFPGAIQPGDRQFENC